MPDSFLLVFVDLFLPTGPMTTQEVKLYHLCCTEIIRSTCGWESTVPLFSDLPPEVAPLTLPQPPFLLLVWWSSHVTTVIHWPVDALTVVVVFLYSWPYCNADVSHSAAAKLSKLVWGYESYTTGILGLQKQWCSITTNIYMCIVQKQSTYS